jgi:uncharacterized membrane protein
VSHEFFLSDGKKETLGERAADKLRNGMGSWRFIFGSLGFLAVWVFIAINKLFPIDNPQLTILNLMLSCLAALQGGILLIAARRADQLSTRIAQHTAEIGDKDFQADVDTRDAVIALAEEFRAFVKAQNEQV